MVRRLPRDAGSLSACDLIVLLSTAGDVLIKSLSFYVKPGVGIFFFLPRFPAGRLADCILASLVATATSAGRRWKWYRQIVPFPHPRRIVADLWCVLSVAALTGARH